MPLFEFSTVVARDTAIDLEQNVNLVGVGATGFETGSEGSRAGSDPSNPNWVVGPSVSSCASAQSNSDSEETLSEFSNKAEVGCSRRYKKKKFFNVKSMALGSAKCMNFARTMKEGKGTHRRKESLRQGAGKKDARCIEELDEALVKGGGFVFDEEVNRVERITQAAVLICPNTPIVSSLLIASPASGLHLLLEYSNSLVPETPLPLLLDSSRKELDASQLFTLQKSNGFCFKVVDNSMVSRLAVLEDIEVAKVEKRGRER